MRTLSDKIERVQNLKTGKDVQYLLNEAGNILNNPIMMFDTDYSLISNTEGVVTDDRFWNELTTTGTFGQEAQQFFKDEGFIDAVANAKNIAFLISEKLKYDRMEGKLFNRNNIHVANLIIIACNKPFEADDPLIFEAVCKMFSDKISTSKLYQDYEKAYQERLIRELIDGNMADKELYAAHVAILYRGLKSHLYTVVLDFNQCDPEHTRLEYFRDLFRRTEPAFKYAVYFHYIVILISSDNTEFNIKKDLNKLNGLFKRKNIYAGVSGSFENIYEMQKHYSDAVDALNLGLSSKGGERVYLYEKINMPPRARN